MTRKTRTPHLPILPLLPLLVALASCADRTGDPVPAEAPEAAVSPPGTPLPAAPGTASGAEPSSGEPDPFIVESLERFREGLEPVDTLSGAAPSREALVERFLDALRTADTLAFAPMATTRREFAWIQYPESRYLVRPYELPADVVWMNQTNLSSRGLSRLLRQYAGDPMDGVGHACPAEPEIEGRSRFWRDCVLVSVLPTGDTIREKAFGSIWERDGRFKFVGYSNEY